MNKKQSKRQRDLKTKLMAAICMLMVSSIMMVSTTYAWFTLSTAPEVTGINTAVGANGNLEIALLPKNGQTDSITSVVGDSVQAVEAKNVTWGNLVDLSDNSVYGLDGITLYPAAINTIGDDTATVTGIGSTPLKTPQYGADGRVAQLAANTSTGYFNAAKGDFYPNTEMGVRGIGTASGMTPRQLAYRNALSAANTATASAKSTASQSLNNNGSTLANIVIKKATGGESTTYTQDDVNALLTIVNDLLGTETKTGALQYIDKAYMNYILAAAASAAVGEGADADQAYVQVEDAMKAEGATARSILSTLPSGVTIGNLADAINKLEATKTAVATAKTELEALSGDSIPWASLSTPLNRLANADMMEVNGIAAGEIMNKIEDLVNSVLSGGGLKVTMVSGGGVYADIADHCGDYSAQVILEKIEYNGIGVKNASATMTTKTTAKYLPNISTAVSALGAPASSAGADMPITDMYGYIIDLAFRTNAAESKLLLQKEGVDRIYSDNSNDATMGHGANMTFNITAGGITVAQLRELMGAIRIVFFTPDENGGTVIKAAALELPASADGMSDLLTADGYQAPLVLGTLTGNGTFTPDADSVELMNLTQNTAQQLSVLVYLDGNLVGNDDVAATAATSMTGKLNLQFASSATLVPMDYSQLHTPATAGGDTQKTTYKVTIDGVEQSGKATAGQDFTIPTLGEGKTLDKVMVGTTDVTADITGNKIPAAKVTGDITITTKAAE